MKVLSILLSLGLFNGAFEVFCYILSNWTMIMNDDLARTYVEGSGILFYHSSIFPEGARKITKHFMITNKTRDCNGIALSLEWEPTGLKNWSHPYTNLLSHGV
jgi:hypothetical protein